MDSQWLQTQFKSNPEKTKAGLAEILGLGAPAISKILAGDRQIKAQEYALMREYFGLPSYDRQKLENSGSRDSYVLDPLESGMREESMEDPDSWVMPASLLKKRTQASPDKIRIFSVQETAMAPDFQPGEQVLVDLSDIRPSPPGVFVVSDGMGHIIRRCAYVPHSDPAKVSISTTSGTYDPYEMPLAQAGITGRVIAKLEWL